MPGLKGKRLDGGFSEIKDLVWSHVTPTAWTKYFSLSEENQEEFAWQTLCAAETALDELMK